MITDLVVNVQFEIHFQRVMHKSINKYYKIELLRK